MIRRLFELTGNPWRFPFQAAIPPPTADATKNATIVGFSITIDVSAIMTPKTGEENWVNVAHLSIETARLAPRLFSVRYQTLAAIPRRASQTFFLPCVPFRASLSLFI